MKLSDLNETVSMGVTSVASIGNVEYVSKPHMIRMYKRCNETNTDKCIATIRRNKGEGWRFKPTNEWASMKLPHIGYLRNIKTPVNGKKTISSNLENMLKAWGVNYDSLMNRAQ